jgi:membrane-associated HD superfamily phosphohydrolase
MIVYRQARKWINIRMTKLYFDALKSLIETTEEQETALADAAAAEQYDREARVTAIVKKAFDKMGLSINDRNHSINYNEDPDREVTVEFYDRISLAQMQALSVIGENITVGASASYPDVTELRMTIRDGIEDAVISETKKR